MCGIAGILRPGTPGRALTETVRGMLARIGHRGPDGSGYVTDRGAAMGAVRLAILDPAGGAQPFGDPSGRFWLCYNGEIYNYRELRDELRAKGHRFATTCDTEVVLAAWIEWGPACLPRFNGGFAFSLLDSRTGELVLARDRFGKRPLFYAQSGDAFVFASEAKAFLAVPGFAFEPDVEQIRSILGVWTPLPDQSGFAGVQGVPMGHWLSVRDGRATLHRYEDLRFDRGPEVASEGEALEAIRARLTESVALRLRSDVEVGVYLSGGVDSAIVARLVRDLSSQPLSTFSVEFEDAEFDESAEQRLVAEDLGTRHLPERIDHAAIAAAAPAAIYHAEVPTFRSAFVPMYILARRTRAEGVKVVLSGEGADEAFLGYDLFKETLLREAWDEMDAAERRDRLLQLYPHYAHYGADDAAALTGLYGQFSSERMPGLFSHELRFQNGRFSARLLKDAGDPFAAISRLVAEDPVYAGLSAVEKAQWLEFKTLLPGYLLSTQGERMSLAHGVENRCPFLDPEVVALASAVNLKFDDGFREKRLLREAFRARLPERVVDKRKFPYRAPDVAAFAATRPDYLDMLLSREELEKVPFLNAAFAQRLADKVLKTAPAALSTKENQTFLFLLSVCQLHRSFVRREGLAEPRLPPVEKVVALDEEAGAETAAHASQGNFISVT